ncbi:hypothetical protein LCGC14_0910150 [marine sediment metagenome]|uniref:Uncharacterized protein n=1 Tax=marine sediment metagenome TaxID=412755 RepID=A0A0F9NTY6_9ZZZZ
MREDLIRMSFSFLAAAVTLAMAQEWITWAIEDHKWWKAGPGVVLAVFAVYEAHKVWRRVESMLGI